MDTSNNKHNKVNFNTHLKLEMDSIKEEDNTMFRGLGKNHDKSLKSLLNNNSSNGIVSTRNLHENNKHN